VGIILEQQRVIEQLTEEVNRLKTSQNGQQNILNHPLQTYSETRKAALQQADATSETKRKPGGQPGHEGIQRLWED